MIPRTAIRLQTSWKEQYADAITNPDELVAFLRLPVDILPGARRAAKQFGLRVPRTFAAQINKGDPHDPLLRQFLPLGGELDTANGYSTDPVGDQSALCIPGMMQKYHGRVLLIVTGACGVHCRYCFRRHFPYSENNPVQGQWEDALAYMQQDASINEVILSGGDPLSLDDVRLENLITKLETVPHLQRLRIHTRLPVVIPDRITSHLVEVLTNTRLSPLMVLHINHPAEIFNSFQHAMMRLKSAGVTLLNQSVLLKGVNDSSETLCELSERLYMSGIMPYYLHKLDRVQGAAHFEVTSSNVNNIMHNLHACLPGYLVPRIVVEQQDAPYKLPLIP